MRDPEDRSADDADDVDPAFGAEFDEDFADGIAENTAVDFDARKDQSRSAWQRLDARRDEVWLREQLSDWDDWDADAEPH